MDILYDKRNFIIYDAGDEVIIHNTEKEFSTGHTHIRNFDTAVYIIDIMIKKAIPHHLHIYLLTSLVKLSNNEQYINKVSELINSKNHRDKSQKYTNSRVK